MKSLFFSLKSLFISPRVTLALMILYAMGLAAATFIEKYQGTSVARRMMYNQPLFYLLPLLMLVQFLAMSLRLHLWRQRKYGTCLLHIALAVILAGALVTHLFGFEGIVHIREGETTAQLLLRDGSTRQLPFSLRLDDFKLTRYPGSRSPSSFESFLTITSGEGARAGHIYMNKVIHEQGYRLYQSSYDTDELGTVLSVNHDPWGTGITYAGYLLLLAALLLIPANPESRFRRLIRELSKATPASASCRKTVSILFFACLPVCLPACLAAQVPRQLQKNTIPVSQAGQWARLQVQCPTGRIEPLDTYTSKLLRKLYRSDTYQGLCSGQVIFGFLLNPSYWNNVPLIRQTNKELARQLSLPPDKYIRFSDLFDEDGHYLLADAAERASSRPAALRTRLEKDLLKLDEKANILYSLQQGRMLSLFPLPDDAAGGPSSPSGVDAGKWYSPGDDLSVFSGKDSLFVSKIFPWYLSEAREALHTGNWSSAGEVFSMINTYQQKRSPARLLTDRQVSWELFYNRADLFFLCAIGYAVAGLLLLFFSLCHLLKFRHWLRTVTRLLAASILLLFLVQTFGIGIRWYIAGRAPWANAYESMVYVAWATALAGLLFIRRSSLTLALAAFFAGIILFVAHLNFMDPEITPLVPILKSYWLLIHVAVVTASYGFFGISFLLGLLSLCFIASGRKSVHFQPYIHELRIINEISLHIGLYLLTAGIFLGAVWANESWGRYWGWDPKETWALITMILYALVLHARLVPSLRSDYAFSLLSVLSFSSVLMTYFGVNYYLSGLHSY